MKALALFLALSATTTANAKDTQRYIPKQFRGDWAPKAEQCSPSSLDGSNLRIEKRTIWTFESRIDIYSVRHIAKDSVEFSSQVNHGIGQEIGYQSRLTLLENRARLAVGDGEEQQFYVRCKS
jgi:hypothetical protein